MRKTLYCSAHLVALFQLCVGLFCAALFDSFPLGIIVGAIGIVPLIEVRSPSFAERFPEEAS